MTDRITKETRKESFVATNVKPRSRMILAVMGEKEMTARDIKNALGLSDMNAVRPRLTELKDMGIIETCGKTFDYISRRTVALFRRVQ